MANRWVYRRPHFPAWKPKIPLQRPRPLVQPRRRRYWRPARRHIAHGHAVLVMGVTAQAGAGYVSVRRIKARIIQPRPQAAHVKIPLPRPFEGKAFPFRRVLKFIQRIREGMQRRLLFRPREIPPIIPQEAIHAISRGEIVSAGAVEGDVFTAGAKRGDVISSHG